jgi:hypothetical protein
MRGKTFALYCSANSKAKLADAHRSFMKAAKTWAGLNAEIFSFGHVADLEQMFRLLHSEAKQAKATHDRGAVFCHASHALVRGDEGKVHVPRNPATPAEKKRYEEISETGVDGNVLSGDRLARQPRLLWSKGARFYIIGCNSGLGANSVAQQFADVQKVTTYGETGYASFSKKPTYFEKIEPTDREIHLPAFFRSKNALLALIKDDKRPLAMPNAALAQQEFKPRGVQ